MEQQDCRAKSSQTPFCVSKSNSWKCESYEHGSRRILLRVVSYRSSAQVKPSRNLPRWQFKMDEDGHCGALASIPMPGLSWRWRHTRMQTIDWQLDQQTASALIDEALSLPGHFPQDCLTDDQLWSDMSEPANGITRDRETDTRCVTINVFEHGQTLTHYALRENCAVLLDSGLHREIELHIASTLETVLSSRSEASSGE